MGIMVKAAGLILPVVLLAGCQDNKGHWPPSVNCADAIELYECRDGSWTITTPPCDSACDDILGRVPEGACQKVETRMRVCDP